MAPTTGATGRLVRLAVEKLKAKAPAAGPIIALVRKPAKAADLGVDLREADCSKPDTLDKALNGVHTLLISSNEVGKRAAQRCYTDPFLVNKIEQRAHRSG